ncbi:MAG: insulinase family protein [Oscillospiraceae bacterium]|nr:insulinase family protein [Oscillospiraceae bacterium]
MAATTKTIIKCPKTGQYYTKISHKSGLDILVWKMDGFQSTEVLFGTKYGSINTMFRKSGDKEYTVVPEGIAHFLEHKLFENEDTDVFELYAKTGASGNAYTTFDKTCYLFSCSDNWEASLEILLSFVQSPYFTKETVDKEQGIIGQEIQMTNDNPYWVLFFNLLKAVYHNHPVRIDVAGTVDSIAQIDADLLYKCYYTFYNLHNMVLSLAGNVDEDKVIEICDKLCKPCENEGLETVFPDEPEKVKDEYVEAILPVGTPIFNIGFKSADVTGRELLKAELEAWFAISMLADSSSPLYKSLLSEGYINNSFYTEIFCGDGYFVSIFGGESKDPMYVQNRICEEIEKAKMHGLDESRFEELKKSLYGSKIRNWDNVEAVANSLINSYFAKVTPFDDISLISEMTFDDVQKCLLERFDTDNKAISVIKSN